MEARKTSLSPLMPPPADAPLWRYGAAVLAGLCAFVWAWSGLLGTLLVAGLVGGAVALAAARWPAVLAPMLWMAVIVNIGKPLGGAVFKASEVVTGLMLAVLMLHLAAGSRPAWLRVRRGGLVLLALAALGVMAMASAWPHPNFFNVRYEIQNYVALVFGLVFFRRQHWPWLIGLMGSAMLAEALIALTLRFGMGLTGWSFFGEGGGVQAVMYSREDIAALAGGVFRLSGTLGHKNLLAAFFILQLPLFALETVRRRPAWAAAALVPSLATLALTDSMTGWGAAVLMLVVALVYLRRLDYLAIFFMILFPIALFALLRFGGTIFFRIEQLFGSQEGWGTVSSRLEMLTIGRDLIAEYPWLGIGRNNFLDYGDTYYSHAHNLFLMKVIEMGIPAGLAFLGFVTAVMVKGWQCITLEATRLGSSGEYYRMLGLWLGLLGFVAMNMFDYNYANFGLGPMFMLLLGVMLSVAWGLDVEEPEGVAEERS